MCQFRLLFKLLSPMISESEAGGFVSVEKVFLVSLGLALIVLAGLWVHTQLQSLSKGTAYTQSQSNKLKKKK